MIAGMTGGKHSVWRRSRAAKQRAMLEAQGITRDTTGLMTMETALSRGGAQFQFVLVVPNALFPKATSSAEAKRHPKSSLDSCILIIVRQSSAQPRRAPLSEDWGSVQSKIRTSVRIRTTDRLSDCSCTAAVLLYGPVPYYRTGS